MAKKSTRLEAFHDLFKENNITASSIKGNGELIQTIRGYAETVEDYRHQSYIRHPLASIIVIVFFAVLANANEWAEIEVFAKKKEKWLRQHLDLPNGIPTDDTYRIVVGNIDAGHFFQMVVQLLIDTVNGILDISGMNGSIHEKSVLSMDGKVSCGSARKETADGKLKALQTLNVYSGDYVLALKENQALFYDEVKSYFDDSMRGNIQKEGCYKKTAGPEQGGTAIREYYITEDTGWFSEKKKWKGLKSFGMVHKVLKKTDGSCLEEDRYYICSIEGDVEEFERAARGHWGVENCLHWHLDFTFRDDKNTSMAKTGAKNLQIMKKIALSILCLVKESYKLSMKRIRNCM